MCMKILITIKTDSELQSYEATALAFLLASFNHDVQLYFANNVFNILNHPNSRIHGMIQSLEFYDMPKAWVRDSDADKLSKNLLPFCHSDFNVDLLKEDNQSFDSYLVF